jgi:hypothetical protein
MTIGNKCEGKEGEGVLKVIEGHRAYCMYMELAVAV